MYHYNITWILESMNIQTWVATDEPAEESEVIELSKQALIDAYKIDPTTLYYQDVLVEVA